MALAVAELREEALVQLRQLAQSPGWAMYQAHLHVLSKRSEVRKAVALRANDVSAALLLQGAVDGLLQAADSLERYMTQVEQGEQRVPGIAGGTTQED